MQLWSSRDFDPPRRTRYYQSIIDEQSLQTGMLYRDLPDSYVVMFAPFDLFGKGRHFYRFRYREERDGGLELRDGTMKVFINSNGTVDDINEDLKAFLHLMNGGEPQDAFCRKVQESVEKARMNPEVRRGFMDWEMQKKMEQAVYYDLGVEKGREEGQAQGMSKMLISLVQDRIVPLSEAAKRLHMTEEEFRALL